MRMPPWMVGVIWSLLLSPAFGQTEYFVVRIPGNEAVAVDMNDLGQVVGNYTAQDGTTHAFLYWFGWFRDLTTSCRTPGEVVGINNRDQIIGSYVPDDGARHTYLQSLLTREIVDVGPGTPYAMNDRGDVVGWGFQGHGYVYSNGTQSFIGPAAIRPALLYYGECINDREQIAVGVGSEISDVYLYSGGTFTNIGSAVIPFEPSGHGNFTDAFAINEHGQITGISGMDWGYDMGFVYSGGSFLSLGWCLPGFSEHCLNNAGQIVGTNIGTYYPPRPPAVAFLYRGGQIFDLNKLIPAKSGIVLTDALAINDAGIIVASGYSTSGSLVGSAADYLLVPVRFAGLR